MELTPPLPQRTIVLASYLAAGVGLWATLYLHLLPALLAGLMVYELVNALTPPFERWLTRGRVNTRMVIVSILTIVVVGLLIGLVLGLLSLLRTEIGNPQELWQNQLMPLIDRARAQLPPWVVDHLPSSVEDLRLTAMEWLRTHTGDLQLAGKEVARMFVHLLIGLVLGAIIALSQLRPVHQTGPLAAALRERSHRLGQAFHDIVFAQIKISLLNTMFTALFLLVALPLFGVHLPLAKTLVLITFVVGLLPVIGNLISNTAITIVALSVSLGTGVAALAFLVGIHKLEYFLNARIVGNEIRARAWELLLAMLVMEAAFGLPGVIAAPIFYAYLKRELEAARLI